MRKYIVFLFGLAFSLLASAENGTCGVNLTWTLEDGILTISGSGAMGNSPGISFRDFRSKISCVIINEGVTDIQKEAFKDFTNLNSVTIPNTVTSIENEAFAGCNGLTSITIPNSVTSIGYKAFSGCSGLTSVTIGNSVTSIGWCAFSGCNDLTSVNISDLSSWFNIVFGDQAANPTYYAHKLVLDGAEIKDLVIPDGVTAVKSSAFYGCHGLTSVTIPNSVTSIGEWAFYECSGLTSVIIGSSVTSIGYDAFSGCSGLTSVSVLAAAPPAFGSDFLSSVGTSTIHVYEGLAEAYRAASGWSSFTIVDDIPLPGSVTISVSADAEMGSVTGAGEYTEGNKVTLTAVAAEGYEFVSWSDGTTENPYVFIANEDKTLTATFKKKLAVFSISATCNSTMGSVTGAGEYTEGDEVTLTAVAAEGYEFVSWSDGTTENPYVFTASENKTLTATFKKKLAVFSISATCNSTMGSVTGAGEYTEGDEVTLTAVAAEGYEFLNWSDGTTENPYIFTASEDKTLTATFKKKETPIGPEPDPDSDILPSTDVSTLPYALYFNDEESRAGDFPLELNMKNAEENITAFQCDVYLPEGIVWKSTTDKRGKVTYNAPTFNEDRTDLSYHTIAPMARKADGSYNIIVYSMDKESILETDGALMTLPLEIPEDMPAGDYNIIVRNIVMTNVNTQQTKVDEVVSRLTIPSYTIGDANGDDEINVTDIVYIISHIRKETPTGFVLAAADVNSDNEVNVTDIVGVIDLIRGSKAGAATRAMSKKAAPSATSNLDVLPFTLTQGTTTASVQLNMNNPGDEFTAFQCDIQLPEGINWAYTVDKRGNKKYTQPTFNAEADRTDATYHTVSAGINQGDGSMNIIVYSMEKETFLDEEGAILDMPFMFDANLAPGIYDIVVKNVVMTRPNNTQIKPADYTFSIMVGSPATEVAALKGRYNAEVLSEFSTALSTNASICAVDLTNADVDAASATLSLGNENALIYLAEGSAIANTKNVVVDGECTNLVLTDDYAFHAPMPFEATDASYSRSVATDGWYSIVLPFAAEIPSGVSVEKFQSLDEAGSVATFTQVMTMEGDVPYIYHASAGNIGFTAQNVEVAATPSEIADGALKGTYSTLEAGSVTGSYVLRGDGTGFGVCDATAYVPAFRAYLQAGGGASNVRIYHDRLTGIHTATSASSDVIYDLCGRRVNKEAKGVVLMNRNKQIKK